MTIETNIERVNAILGEYAKWARKSMPEVMAKVGGNLALYIFRELKAIAPTVGKIDQDIAEAKNRKQGLKVRKSAKAFVLRKYQVRTMLGSKRQIGIVKSLKKRTDIVFGEGLWELMKQREIAIRHSSIGFLAITARYPKTIRTNSLAKNKFGRTLSEVLVDTKGEIGTTALRWGDVVSKMSENVREALTKPRSQRAIIAGINSTERDMLNYIADKMEKATAAANAQPS